MTLRTLLAYCLAPLGHSFAAVRPNRQPLAVPKASPGFTVIELVTALVIAGVLGTLAVPRYHSTVVNARRGEAKANLSHIASLQSVYRIEHDFSPFTDLSVGYVNGNADSCANNVANKGLRNALGFRPEGCDSLRYGYTTDSSGNAEAYGPSDAPDRWIYPDCAGSSVGTQCGQTQGDVVRIAANSTKADVCRDIIEFCPGGGTVPPPPICIPACGACQTCNAGVCSGGCDANCEDCVSNSCQAKSPLPLPPTCPCSPCSDSTYTQDSNTCVCTPPCPSNKTACTKGATTVCCNDATQTCDNTVPVCNSIPLCSDGTPPQIGGVCTCDQQNKPQGSSCPNANWNDHNKSPSCTCTTCDDEPQTTKDACSGTWEDSETDLSNCCKVCNENTCNWTPNINSRCAPFEQTATSCTDTFCSTPRTRSNVSGTLVCASGTECCNTTTGNCVPITDSVCGTCQSYVCNDPRIAITPFPTGAPSDARCCRDKTCAAPDFAASRCTDSTDPHYDAAKPHYDSAGTYPDCCVECNTDQDCGAPLKKCVSNVCEDKTCDPDFTPSSCIGGTYVSGGTYPDGCCVCPSGKVLDTTTNACVDCVNDSDCPDCESCISNTCRGLTSIREGNPCVDVRNVQCCIPGTIVSDVLDSSIPLTCNASNECCPPSTNLPDAATEVCTTACGCAATSTDTEGNPIELKCVADDDDSTVGTCEAVFSCAPVDEGTRCNTNASLNPPYEPTGEENDICCRDESPSRSSNEPNNKLECRAASSDVGQCCYTPLAGTGTPCRGEGCCVDGLKCKVIQNEGSTIETCCPYPHRLPDLNEVCISDCGCDNSGYPLLYCKESEDITDNGEWKCCKSPRPKDGEECTTACGCAYGHECKNFDDGLRCCPPTTPTNKLPDDYEECAEKCGCKDSSRSRCGSDSELGSMCCPRNLPDDGDLCTPFCGCETGFNCIASGTMEKGLCSPIPPTCVAPAEGIGCSASDQLDPSDPDYTDTCCSASAHSSLSCQDTDIHNKECCDSLRPEGTSCLLGNGQTGCCERGSSCLKDEHNDDICRATYFDRTRMPNFPLKPIKCFSNRLTASIRSIIHRCAKQGSGLENETVFGPKNGSPGYYACGEIRSIFSAGNYWLSS